MTSTDAEPLDSEQRAAVGASEKAIAVLAGPGSGKTRTLSHRARHLLLQDPKSRALLLTFTNKAAAEMKTRAIEVGNLPANRIEAGTFHGFGASLLRSHGELVDITPDFDILDADERDAFAAEVAIRAGLSDRAATWSYRRLRRLPTIAAVTKFGEAYEAAKRAEGLVDFDDLVVYAAQILEDNAALSHAYGTRFPHVLVDEFQDTNLVHFAIVRALFPSVQTISVFADDDQAIMRFAGADAENVRRFADELGAKGYPLTRNYRSREAIVTRANRLIAADPESSGRQMQWVKPGGTVDPRRYDNTTAEAEAVGAEIAGKVLGEGVPASSIAVLSRSGPRANELVSKLQRLHVPVTDWRGAAYEPAERRMLITCMTVIRARLNNRQAQRLADLMRVDVVDERDTHAFLHTYSGNPVADELLGLREDVFNGARPSEAVERARRAIAAHDEGAGVRARALADAVIDFERFDPDFSLEQLLTELALKSGGRPPTQGGGVKVATLHGTKGLQWPTVYLLGLEEGKLPDYRAVQDGLVPEERRACFVGVSRAEDQLILTYAQRFRTFMQQPSRFLAEMGL